MARLKDNKHKYYIQFADDMDVKDIPARQLAGIGTWSRRSSHIYQGTSVHTKREIEDYLAGTCKIPSFRFTVTPDEDAIYLER